MHGLKFDKNESQNDLVSEIFETRSFIRKRRQIGCIVQVSLIRMKSQGLTIKPIIIKFRSWRYRQNVYKNRPRRFENGKKKPGEIYFSVSLDLIKRKYNFFKFVQEIVKEMDNVSFVCADVNRSLAIRLKNDIIKHFNREYEFCLLLSNSQVLLLLQFFYCLKMFILISFLFFIVLRGFIFQIVIIDVLSMATYLITGFYVNNEGSSYNIFFLDAG